MKQTNTIVMDFRLVPLLSVISNNYRLFLCEYVDGQRIYRPVTAKYLVHHYPNLYYAVTEWHEEGQYLIKNHVWPCLPTMNAFCFYDVAAKTKLYVYDAK